MTEAVGLTLPVAQIAVDAQSLLQRPGRARIVPGLLPHFPEVIEGSGFALAVAEVPGGLHGPSVAGDGVWPGAVLPQESSDGSGKSDNLGKLAGTGGLV